MQLDRKKNGAGIVVHIKREGRSRGIPAFKASGGRKGEGKKRRGRDEKREGEKGKEGGEERIR